MSVNKLGTDDLDSFTALAAIGQFKAVKLTAVLDQVEVCDGATDRVEGISQDDPSALGRPVSVAISGVTKWKAGGTIAIGDTVGTDGNGDCVAKSTAGNFIRGIARQAGVVGDIVAVRLTDTILHA